MDWSTEIGSLVLGGLGGLFPKVFPQHLQRQALARLNDYNPWDVIPGNHDLLRAARLAWIEATIQVLDAARERAQHPAATGSSSSEDSNLEQFENAARPTLKQIRHDALDRNTNPGSSPIDSHIQIIMQGTAESVAPSRGAGLDRALTTTFEETLAELTSWKVEELPTILGQIARMGLPTIRSNAFRTFGELVFAAFAELLKSPTKYPEAGAAFTIAMNNAARELTESVLQEVKGLDRKLDQVLSGLDTLKVFRDGAQKFLDALPQLLEGQARIEALATEIKADTNEIKETNKRIEVNTEKTWKSQEKLERLVLTLPDQIVRLTQQLSTNDEKEIFAQVRELVDALDRREFEKVLTSTRPKNLDAYRATCIARWSQARYAIDKRFTPLTLLLDQGIEAGERYQRDQREFTDLRDVLKAIDSPKESARQPVLVVTGAPGSGKSTLLRRLELDLASEALRAGGQEAPLTMFLPLNNFGKGEKDAPEVEAWIATWWNDNTDGLPEFNDLLRQPLILLFDGLNEMPCANGLDRLKSFLNKLPMNFPSVRVVFSCRTLDYGNKLSTKDLPRIPQVEVKALTPPQVKDFLACYAPKSADKLFQKIQDSRQLDFYSSPYYLKLLIEQAPDGNIPEGRAALFTGYVRAMLQREIAGDNPRLCKGALLLDRDRDRIGTWKTPYELPERGPLFRGLAALSYRMQERHKSDDKSQVRVDYDKALDEIAKDNELPPELCDKFLKAAADLQILDRPDDDVMFVHQLLQEYFAARHAAKLVQGTTPANDTAAIVPLAAVKWRAAEIKPNVAELLKSLPNSGTLPDLPTTGWEETFALTAALLPEPDRFLQALAETNLPLAGRCAAQPEVRSKVSEGVIHELRKSLLERSRDPAADLRARIEAGHALGALGDPRFEVRHGPFGRFLAPPMIPVEGGRFPIGAADPYFSNPAREVDVEPFSLGQFPVTNAEYRCFVEAKGYQHERWWKSEAGQRWRRGEGTSKARRTYFHTFYARFKGDPGAFREFAERYAWSPDEINAWQGLIKMGEEEVRAYIENQIPDQQFSEPEFWDDPRFYGANQPVVGVSWFEANAYCEWLSESTGTSFRLPEEEEWEVAARGNAGRLFAWANDFDPQRCNSIETKLRRTTPVGVFPGGDTPGQRNQQGFVDLTGNVWEWTSSRFVKSGERSLEESQEADLDPARVLRGGSWVNHREYCHCAYRLRYFPGFRLNNTGFRVCFAPPIS